MTQNTTAHRDGNHSIFPKVLMAYVVLDPAAGAGDRSSAWSQSAISQQNYEWRSFDNDDSCFDYSPKAFR
jgi:hypothetical protein